MSQRRVIKIGGSLLDLSDLAQRIASWIESAERRQNIFLWGGGGFCNEMRSLHQRFGLTEGFSHQRCLELMSVTAELGGVLLELPVIDELAVIRERGDDLVFDARKWLLGRTDLPGSWEVTSDSISALLARELGAELCLMKSVSSRDAVDGYFWRVAPEIGKIDWVNLRN